MSDNIIVLPRDETAAFLAAVADLEDYRMHTDLGGGAVAEEVGDAIDTLSRIAAAVNGQTEAQ